MEGIKVEALPSLQLSAVDLAVVVAGKQKKIKKPDESEGKMKGTEVQSEEIDSFRLGRRIKRRNSFGRQLPRRRRLPWWPANLLRQRGGGMSWEKKREESEVEK